ncbi:MAG: hypothetical protein IPP71_16510 [Bacteroidetes bacterium]|nr:hypothetical protein [Bacteroidota bacterium]
MKNTILKFACSFLIPMMVVFTSCKDDKDDPEPTCVGGKGGAVTFVLKPQHHGEPIPSTAAYPDSAFIKFNVSEFPGDNPALYDLVVVGTDGAFEVNVDSMKCGKYFIFMTGFDASIAERVKGGIPVTISIETGTKVINIPVTED